MAERNFLQVRYVRLLELLTDLAIARGNGTFPKAIQQYKKPALLILDKWLLYPLGETKARDLLEIAEARYKKLPQYSVLSSTFPVGAKRSEIRYLPTLSATALFTMLTASSLTAKNR